MRSYSEQIYNVNRLQAYGVHNCGDTKSAQVIIDVEHGKVQFSSCWLLHQLIFYLEGFMMHKYIHRKYGIYNLHRISIEVTTVLLACQF